MAEEIWHLLDGVEKLPTGETRATVSLSAASPWFSGHFPGAPILPGIAMLSMVRETMAAAKTGTAGNIAISAIKRVRFRQPVQPSDRISVLISGGEGEDGKSYSFKIMVDRNVACSGIVTLA